MKVIFPGDRLRLAAGFLSAAFMITFLALTAFAFSVHHEKQQEKERNAVLIASDILALQESCAAGDGREDVYAALIESRLAWFAGRAETDGFLTALRCGELDLLAQRVEDAITNGRYSDACLRDILIQFQKTGDETVSPQTASVRTAFAAGVQSRIKDAARLMDQRIGVPVYRNTIKSQERMAFCKNALVSFHELRDEIQSYTAACQPGSPVLSSSDCAQRAIYYVKEEHRLDVRGVTKEWSQDGVCYVCLAWGEETALAGVREDSGGICFFLRSLKNPGNVLQ